MKNGLTYIFLLISITALSQGKIELQNADRLEYDEQVSKDANRLIGNVVFEHNGTYMYCDSAYFYQKKNSLEAFGKVHIKQGDTLNLFCDYLEYSGDSSLAKLRNNITLKNNKATLTTNILDYNVKTKIASYHNWGKIKDAKNNLISKHGYYYSDTKTFYFKEKARLDNPKYLILADTLQYNSANETSYFFGNASITSATDTILCQKGWYDTKKDKSEFKKNAIIKTKEQTLKGETLYYDRKLGYGKALKNVEILQRKDKVWLTGNYAEYFQKKDSSIITKNPMLTQLIGKDTFYLKADTILAFQKVTNKTDTFRYTKAYNKVQFYKNDLQGKCDSLRYSYSDSTMQMIGEPILWNGPNQLTSDSIHLITGSKQLKELRMFNNAFIISQEDSIRYNQIKGRNMIGYFNSDNKMQRVKVIGNGETIYYGREKDSTYIGVNKAICSDIIIYLDSNHIDKITFLNKPDATLYPINELPISDLTLKNFKWFGDLRPVKSEFIKETTKVQVNSDVIKLSINTLNFKHSIKHDDLTEKIIHKIPTTNDTIINRLILDYIFNEILNLDTVYSDYQLYFSKFILGEFLEEKEIDFDIKRNKELLTIQFSVDAVFAYPVSHRFYFTLNTNKKKQVRVWDLFSSKIDKEIFIKHCDSIYWKNQVDNIRDLKNREDIEQEDIDYLEANKLHFDELQLSDFYFDKGNLVFEVSYGLSRAIRALAPSENVNINLSKYNNFLKPEYLHLIESK